MSPPSSPQTQSQPLKACFRCHAAVTQRGVGAGRIKVYWISQSAVDGGHVLFGRRQRHGRGRGGCRSGQGRARGTRAAELGGLACFQLFQSLQHTHTPLFHWARSGIIGWPPGLARQQGDCASASACPFCRGGDLAFGGRDLLAAPDCSMQPSTLLAAPALTLGRQFCDSS